MADELLEAAEASARASFFLASGTIVATVIMAISAILIGRLLGPELYGQYSLILSAPQLLFLFTDFGINQGIIKFAASLRAEGKHDSVTRLIQNAVKFKILLGTAFFAINFVFADFFALLVNRPELAPYVRIASFSIIFQVILSTVSASYVGLDKTEYDPLTTNTQAIIKTIFSVALVLLGFSVAGAIIGNVLGYVVAGILGLGIVFFKLLKPPSKIAGESMMRNLKMLLTYGAPLYASALLAGFTGPYQNILLGFFTTDLDIGNFRAATNFVVLIGILPASINTALFPAFSKLYASKGEKIKDFFKITNKYTCLLIVPIITLIIILSKEIVQVIYGSTYQSAFLFLSLSILVYFLVAIGYANLTSLFNGLGETRITFKITLINVLTLTILAPFFAKTYNVPGLIIASLLSSFIGTLYASYVAITKFKIEFDIKSIMKIYLISATSGIPIISLTIFTHFPEVFKVVFGGFLYIFIYVTLAPLTGVINNSEIQTLKNITQKTRSLALISKPLLRYWEKISKAKAAPQHDTQ